MLHQSAFKLGIVRTLAWAWW